MEKILKWKKIKYSLVFILFLAGLLFMLLAAPRAHGFVFHADQDVNFTEELTDDLYTAGQIINIDTTINGDLFAAGQSVNIKGRVGQDLTAAGQIVNISEEVSDDVRVAGQIINIEKMVGGDVIAAGQNINIMPTSGVKGDVALTGETVEVGSNISGNALLAGRKIVISAVINGDVEIEAEEIIFEKNGSITGNLNYKAPQEIKNLKQKVGGLIDYKFAPHFEAKAPWNEKDLHKWLISIILIVLLVTFVGALLIAIIFGIFCYPFSKQIGEITSNHFWKSFGLGWAFIIGTLIATFFLFWTVIGIQLGFFLLTIWGLTLFLSDVLLAIVAASFFTRKNKKLTKGKYVLYVALSLLIIYIISIIPIIDLLFWLFTIPTAIGVMMLLKIEIFKKMPKSRK